MRPCQFDEAYQSKCRNWAQAGSRYCNVHTLACCSCGHKASHTCPAHVGGGVCGDPLCPRCVHFDDGTHGVLPDDPTPEAMARDLTRNVLEREPPPTRTVVQDLTELLEELR